MPYFDFDHHDWKDSGGPTPPSRCFGEYRRWHPDLSFLSELRVNGELGGGPCQRFTPDEEKLLIVHPAHQNPEHAQNHTVDDAHNLDRV